VVIANDDEKAICFCGKTTFTALALGGTVTKLADSDGFGCTGVGLDTAGAAGLAVRGAGVSGADSLGPPATAECSASEFAGGCGFGTAGAAEFALGVAGDPGPAAFEPPAAAGFAGSEFAVEGSLVFEATFGFVGSGLEGGADGLGVAVGAGFADSEAGFSDAADFGVATTVG
jgi:hypothetical protein